MEMLGWCLFWWSALSLLSITNRFRKIKVNNKLWKITDKETGDEWLTNDYWVTKLTDSTDLPPK